MVLKLPMSQPTKPGSRIEMEDLWRTRLAEAKRNYHQATTQFRLAADEHRKGEIPSPDGSLRLSQAISAEARARGEYVRILRLFTDLIMHGRAPKDQGTDQGN